MPYIWRYLDLSLPTSQSAFLWGARKTGKSTYLKQHYKDAIYIDLLQADVFHFYLQEPHRLREELITIDDPKIVIIDEIQKVAVLLDEVHWLIENKKNLQFILCGSSSRKIKTSGANLLGGRAWRYQLLPLVYPELGELNWQKIMNHGLLPSHYNESSANKSLAAYLYDYLLTEVHLEASIRNRDTFFRFIETLGFCHGEMLNYSNIARDVGVDSKTVKAYFEILEDMYIGHFLRPYNKSANRQIITEKPKFYLFDTGIANYLKRYEFKEFRGIESGRAFEHYFFLELKAYTIYKEIRDDIFYWRTREGYEVDFIIGQNAIETKITKSVSKKDLKGLLLFGQIYKFTLHLVCLEPRKRLTTIEGQKILIWPIEEFLKALWAGEIITES